MLSGTKPRRRPKLTAASLASFIALGSPVARAQSTTEELASRHFEPGVAASEETAPPTQMPLTAPAADPAPARAEAAPDPTSSAPSPEARRLPAFISLGVGGLMGGAALATGLVAKVQYDEAKATCGPTCAPEQLSGSRTFALTSTVLTGAAVLGVGLGVALLLATPEGESTTGGTAPRWDVSVSSRAAAASAAWSF